MVTKIQQPRVLFDFAACIAARGFAATIDVRKRTAEADFAWCMMADEANFNYESAAILLDYNAYFYCQTMVLL